MDSTSRDFSHDQTSWAASTSPEVIVQNGDGGEVEAGPMTVGKRTALGVRIRRGS
jgi:hypothetical protein